MPQRVVCRQVLGSLCMHATLVYLADACVHAKPGFDIAPCSNCTNRHRIMSVVHRWFSAKCYYSTGHR